MKTCIYPLLLTLLCNPNQAQAESNEEIGTDQKVLKAYELYLRDKEVTLNDRQMSYGVDVAYQHDEDGLGMESRLITSTLSANYGLSDDLEIGVSLPVTLSDNVRSDLLEFDESESMKVRDLTLGANYALSNRTTFNGAVTLPVDGGDTRLAVGVNMHQEYDPIVLHGGVAVERMFDNKDTTTATGNIGLILSVNHHIAVGGGVQTSYTTSDTGGFKSREQTLLTSEVLIDAGKGGTLSPSVSFGVNDSAPDVIIGFGWSKRM